MHRPLRVEATLPPVRIAVAIASAFVLLLSACGGDDGGGSGGTIRSDGSSTVGPFMQAAAERFQGENEDARVTVGVSGTGGGFELCRGDTDISNASRPIDEDEEQACSGQGIEFVELPIANDALTVVANPENDWETCLTVEQLKKIWEPGSKVGSWKDVDPGFPDESIKLYGPGTDSGTFDYFTAEINGEEGASRTDYSASEDDNVIVRGVEGHPARWATSDPPTSRRTRTASRRSRSIPETAASRPARRRLRTASTSRSPGRSSST